VLSRLLYVALAGALGTLARYGLAGAVQRVAGSSFPWGTAAVNVAGCFMLGVGWSLAETRLQISSELRTVCFAGFMGAFTTFSTYALETGQMLRDSEWLVAAGNVALQNGVGIASLLVGLLLGRLV